MELIRISQTKLKIMLSAEDVEHFELTSADSSDISGRAAFRRILREARDKCGFDAVSERVFVQYYPEKGGGCEMFVTKLAGDVPDGKSRSGDTSRERKRFTYASPVGEGKYDSGYIVYSFSAVADLISTCKSMRTSQYKGESMAYRIKDKCRYYLVLTGETYFAGENNGRRCENSYYYVLTEHGELICTDAVSRLGVLA